MRCAELRAPRVRDRDARTRATAIVLLVGGWGIWGCGAAPPAADMRPPGEPVHEVTEPRAGRPEVGLASWYGRLHQGLVTASGEIFDMRRLTAAHRSLPLGTRLRVTNLANGRTVRVRVNDRGPYVPGRIVDLSREAARAIGMVESGVTLVRLDVDTAVDTALPTRAARGRPRPDAPGGWT